jgi:hypothetical protein
VKFARRTFQESVPVLHPEDSDLPVAVAVVLALQAVVAVVAVDVLVVAAEEDPVVVVEDNTYSFGIKSKDLLKPGLLL